jgi:signal transduction histidine kinase
VFRVQASNGEGVWSGGEATLAFTVAPRYWQTAWFQLATLAVAGLAMWGAYRIRVRQVARQLNLRFEERLAERTRIARELHDTLLQGFLSASMQLHVAADNLPDDSPAKASLAKVSELMQRVIDEGRNAVRGLRSGVADDDLEQAFAGIQQEVAPSPARYRVIRDGRPQPLNPVIRDEVYRIGREALINAFRHAGAHAIELHLEYGPRQFTLRVRDDGRGIDPDVVGAGADGHWGLSGMRERAERIGASFNVWSRDRAGTEIELAVPARIAFTSAARRERHHRRAAPSRTAATRSWKGR